jgi:hypothetical protein
MDTYAVRGIFMVFALGGAAIMFARSFAYWLEWTSWTVRIVGMAALGFGLVSVAFQFGAVVALKAVAGTALGVGLYVWQDVAFERAEEKRRNRSE